MTGTSYKLILMDYSMPYLNGPDATREILGYLSKQAQEGITTTRPLIYCFTAYMDKEFKENALSAGMDDLFTKLVSKE